MISLVHSSTSGSATISIPEHQPGDLLVLYATRSSGSPGLPSGWSEVQYRLGGNVGNRVMVKDSTDGSGGSVSASGAGTTTLLIYRGAGIGASDQLGSASQLVVDVPALTLENADGSSWVAVFSSRSGANEPYDDYVPSAGSDTLTLRQTAAGSSPIISLDTDGGVSSWPGGTLTYEDAQNRSGVCIAVELIDLSSAPTGPTLTNGAASATGASSAVITVDTDTATGTAYCVVTSDSTKPTGSQIRSGEDHNGSPALWADDQTVEEIGALQFESTDLPNPETQYYAHIVHNDGTDDSNIVTVGFVTLSESIGWVSEPKVASVGPSSITIRATPDQPCNVHVIALALGAEDVTEGASIVAGEDGDGQPAAAHDWGMSDGSEVTLALSGLTDPVYNVRVVAHIPDPE